MGKKHLTAAGLVILTLIGAFLVLGTTPGTGIHLFGGPANASSKCATSVTYMAYSAPAGSNNFGAAINPATATAGVRQAHADFCGDPLEFATDKAYAETGLGLNAAAAQATARYYVQHPAVWAYDVDKFFETAKSWALVNDLHKYYSIGMKRGANKKVMPVLVRGSDPVKIGMALTFKYNGQTRELRLACRLQPVEHQPFTHVPATPATPVAKCTSGNCGHPTTCTTCGGTTSGCIKPPSPGPGWVWHPELCKWVCVCISKASASQQVPAAASGAAGVPTGGNGPATDQPGTQGTATPPGGNSTESPQPVSSTQAGGGGNNSSSVPPAKPSCGPLSNPYVPC